MSISVERLPDVQADSDARCVALDDVGVAGLRYPISIELADGTSQHTVCEAQLTVSLSEEIRGTHMSRFVEAIHQHKQTLSPLATLALARGLATRLDADEAAVTLAFPLFIPREAPITGHPALLAINCTFAARVGIRGQQLQIGARVPVTSLCPCSKEIADYSAHSQRGYVQIDVIDQRWIAGEAGLWPQELVNLCDHAASAPIYPILKRPDERHVTMLAYDKPAFVEDLARDIAIALKDDQRISGFTLEVVNQESIHDHQAFARLAWQRS
jgi:GTP cyclohydrolase IB